MDRAENILAFQEVEVDSNTYFSDFKGFVYLKLMPGRHYALAIVDSIKDQRQSFSFTGNPSDTIKVTVISYLTDTDKINTINAIRIKGGATDIESRTLNFLPTIGSGLDFVKLMAGVFSSSELTSQYNVRGGNYDENLVYVNDIEIYRPQLVRTGQQEGLSFVNSDLISNINFYPGGFEAKYGDKSSSVLDVKYIKPDSFLASVSAGLLGINAFIANKPHKKFTYVIGGRYRANNYLLNSLDVKGNYSPKFYDVQGLFTYQPNFKWQIELLGNIGVNQFSFRPVSQTTKFGTISRALQLTVAYAGLENMNYINATNALSITYRPSIATEYKFISSLFNSLENEYYTVEGAYDLGELDNNLGSDNFGQKAQTIGYGYFINHARNELQSYVINNTIIGKHQNRATKVKTEWRLNYKNEVFDDRILEWKYNDSSEINIAPSPLNDDTLNISYYLKTNAQLSNQQWSASVQKIIPVLKKFQGVLNVGARATYRTLGNHQFISPRARFSFKPKPHQINDTGAIDKDLTVNINAGYYYQPAFYREMRNLQGVLNTNILPQKSIHFTAGIEYYFKIWDRKFKYTGDAYYKILDDIIPYAIDNVRIRYFAMNNGKGYATGIDNRIYGEFIKGMESWFNFSVLSTKEKFNYLDSFGTMQTTGWQRRPTDARVVSSIFFQDDLPRNKSYRMSMTFSFASGLPFYFLESDRYQATSNRIPAYQRVDIGFQKLLITAEKRSNKKCFKNIESAFVSIDVFNLLANNNIISYNIVKDFANNYYGVPNYLTGRRLNLRLYIGF